MDPIHLPHDHGRDAAAVLEKLPSPEEFQEAAELLRQVGDGSRLRLFWLLCHCEECVINLSAMMGMSSPAVSHHLKQLRGSRLIVSRREGKEVYYRSADTLQARLLHQLAERLIAITCPSQPEEPPPEGPAGPEERPGPGNPRQLETVRAVHARLTERLDRRWTIEELARLYLVNTSTLKAAFKAAYGLPIAAYMKEYRVRRAAELLRETDRSVAEIAAAVGYGSQSKFTAAFKDVLHILPTDYRKQGGK